jgi:hypothetical protein
MFAQLKLSLNQKRTQLSKRIKATAAPIIAKASKRKLVVALITTVLVATAVLVYIMWRAGVLDRLVSAWNGIVSRTPRETIVAIGRYSEQGTPELLDQMAGNYQNN